MQHYHRMPLVDNCLEGPASHSTQKASLVVSRMRGRSYSYSPSPPRRGYHRRGRSPSPRGRNGGRGRDMATSLLVRNLRHGIKPEDLRKAFGEFGQLKDIYLPRDYYTGEPRGFGFVQYVDPDDASEAKYQMDGQILLGRELTVVFAEENRKKPADMRARERVSGRHDHDQRSPRRARSSRYSRSRSPRYSRSPRRGRSRTPARSRHSPSPRPRSYSRSPVKHGHPPTKRSPSPLPRQRASSRAHRERSYPNSPIDNGPRSRSPFEEEERVPSRSVSR